MERRERKPRGRPEQIGNPQHASEHRSDGADDPALNGVRGNHVRGSLRWVFHPPSGMLSTHRESNRGPRRQWVGIGFVSVDHQRRLMPVTQSP